MILKSGFKHTSYDESLQYRFDQTIARRPRDQKNNAIADTDAEAERVGVPLFEEQREHRARMRNRILAERGESMAKPGETGVAPTRNVTEHSLICGSPATVAERLAKIDAIGVGGVILQFRLGSSPYDIVENSVRLFMEQVAPQFEAQTAS